VGRADRLRCGARQPDRRGATRSRRQRRDANPDPHLRPRGVRFVGEVREEEKPAAFAPKMSAEPGTAARLSGARSLPLLSIVVLPSPTSATIRIRSTLRTALPTI
jgi:hypothetical protein